MTTLDTIILDRDGTLIRECHYLSDPDKVSLIPGVAQAMRHLGQYGVRFFLVSNQSGIGRGLFGLDKYKAVHKRLEDLLARARVQLTATAFCPHAPADNCSCRKPRTGLWHQLAANHKLDPRRTAMVGDKIVDLAFGQAVGCNQTVLVATGHGLHEAQKLGLPTLSGPLQHCPQHPGWPTIYARSLADYLIWLVQHKDKTRAHRV